MALESGAGNQARLFELAQFQRQDAVGDAGIVALQLTEPLGAVLEIVKQQAGPAPAQHLHDTGFTGAFSPLWYAMEMTRPDPVLEASLQRYGREAVIDRHDKLEAMLGDTPFLVGHRPSLADGVLIGVARWLDFHQVAEPERWPRLLAVRRRIEADPAVQFALVIEDGHTPIGSGALLGQIPLSEVIERFGARI